MLNNRSSPEDPSPEVNWDAPGINFEEFCVISSYLSVLQQEIEENCCVSPIKGTNLPPPPIYLTNTPGNEMKKIIKWYRVEKINLSPYLFIFDRIKIFFF